VVATVLLVPYSGELWLTLTNAQWFGALLLVAVLAAPDPSSTAGRAALRRFGTSSCFASPTRRLHSSIT